MCNEPTKDANYSGPPIVQAQSSISWLLLWIFSTLLVIISSVVAARSPACTAPYSFYPTGYYSSSNTGYGYWFPGPWCYTTYLFVPPILATAVVFGSLNFAGLRQLITTSPSDASSSHFCCMFTWSIILAGNVLGLAGINAGLASVPVGAYSGYYCPSYYGYYWRTTTSSPSSNCATGRIEYAAWKARLISQSAFAHGFYAFSCYWFVLFTVISIVISSRVRYWCTDDCKTGCQECTTGPEDDCNTCVCCLYPPGQGPTPNQASSAVAMVPQGGVSLNVNQQPVMMQQQPVMGNEVQYWLTNELGLPQYVPPFVQNGYTTLSAVLYAFNTDADLRNVIPNILPGHAAMILSNLQGKRQYSQPAAAVQVGGTVPNNGEGMMTR